MYKPEKIEVFKEDREHPALIDTGFMNARTLAQDSIMSLHAENISKLDERILPVNRFFVPATLKSPTAQRLKMLGFTAERMYSDLTTAALEFKELLRAEG
ncbi:hypothetical protein P0F65_05230 [Sphingomonas sp. I4]